MFGRYKKRILPKHPPASCGSGYAKHVVGEPVLYSPVLLETELLQIDEFSIALRLNDLILDDRTDLPSMNRRVRPPLPYIVRSGFKHIRESITLRLRPALLAASVALRNEHTSRLGGCVTDGLRPVRRARASANLFHGPVV